MRDHHSHRRLLGGSLALGLLLVLAFASVAEATHPRLGTATPFRVPLVPAFVPCAPPGPTMHGGPPPPQTSCPGPILESPFLTTSAGGVATGFVRLDQFCAAPSVGPAPCLDVAGDQQDITISGLITDVQCSGPVAPGCPGGAGIDYVGPVVLQLPVRLTDHWNAPPGPPPPPCAGPAGGPPCITATVNDFVLGVPTGCAPVGAAGAPPGSTCAWATSIDAVYPMINEIQRQSFRTYDEVTVQELGPDGTWGPMCPPLCGTGDEGTTRAAGWLAP